MNKQISKQQASHKTAKAQQKRERKNAKRASDDFKRKLTSPMSHQCFNFLFGNAKELKRAHYE